MMTRNQRHNLIYLHPLALKLTLPFLKPLVPYGTDKFYTYVRMRERRYGFHKVLNPGDVAVQAGVATNPFKASNKWWDNSSQLWQIAQRIGPTGTAIVIEPDPKNIEKIKKIIEDNDFGCRFILLQRALYKEKDEGEFLFGVKTSANRLNVMENADNWMLPEQGFGPNAEGMTKTLVQMDSLDNILDEFNIPMHKVKLVNLTINGAEFDALKGMTGLLKSASDISITAIAGRETEGHGERDMGYIDGRPDHEVIGDFMKSYEFDTQFKRFWRGKYGYVVGTKGNQKVFM